MQRGPGILALLLGLVVPALSSVPFNDMLLQNEILATDDIWIVTIMPPDVQCNEHCMKVKSTIEKIAPKTAGIFNFASGYATDVITDDEGESRAVMEVFNITEAPHLLVFPFGPKTLSTAIQMPAQSAVALGILSPKMFYKNLGFFLPSFLQRVAEGSSYTRFLSEKDPALQRLLVFSKKPTTNIMKKLSLDFDRRLVAGESKDSDLAARFGLSDDDFPALFLSPGPDAPESQWLRYSGDVTYLDVTLWLEQHVQPIPLHGLHSQGAFEEQCVAPGGVCFIAALPIASSNPSNPDDAAMMATWRGVASRAFVKIESSGTGLTAVQLPLRFSWVQSEKQSAFLSSFGVTNAPTVVAVNPRKKQFSVFKGAFNEDSAYEFVKDVMNGNGELQAVDDIQPLFTVTEEKPKKGKKGKKKGKKGKKKGKKGKEKNSASAGSEGNDEL